MEFAIDARSCTLLKGKKPGLLDGPRFVIPVYQRPYSWGEEEVSRLFRTIITAYQNGGEPAFLGTAQLMPREDQHGTLLHYDIIDGQQRLTTLALFFKVLELCFPAVEVPATLRGGQWLSTRVNKGAQQQWLQEVFDLATLPADAAQHANPYIANAAHIYNALSTVQEADEEGRASLVVTQALLTYVLYDLHVVVIETRAGLAKTLDIFNTINTAGMDLNAGDVFKIQLYEYLARRADKADAGAPDRIFDRIDDFYGRINASKFANGHPITTIGELLEVYKYILIAQEDGSQALHGMSTDTFFEQLFAYLLLGEKRPEFNKLKEALGDDPLSHLNRILDARLAWESYYEGSYHVWYTLNWWTRYGGFWLVDVVYLYRFSQEADYSPMQFREWKALLVRYYSIQSLLYRKMVNHARGFTYDMLNQLVAADATQEGINGLLREYIASSEPGWLKWQLLNDPMFDNAKRCQLAVRLGAMLDHEDWDETGLQGKFFGEDALFDVEHIRPCNPEEPSPDDAAWESQQHKLGNLILLERGLNRSGEVSNHDFHYKCTNGYEASEVKIIKRLQRETAESNHAMLRTWTPAKAATRTAREAERLIRFLYADCVSDDVLNEMWAAEAQAMSTSPAS
ncbi:DUF262 domain-containing protein [Hymenobacter convexus]|uniref:DUF262 domain-containing protein n=1 Tax=Hymenobacter sp. CA1UV-4 TaxID=3063782 RepID=UPI00271278C2|nr:DUF262 domain-containing HNH endonuclease family protein [Hymenobacter sp. CA1UV-4]MDO7850402.1 DUF262 domain-containing HNH endonuclease family protein [Hymenobacter sp. CA1UV-4]